nr:hypothetical protein [Tanacetum cinerariifolium]
ECKGRAGWFPLGYIERRERVLASKAEYEEVQAASGYNILPNLMSLLELQTYVDKISR